MQLSNPLGNTANKYLNDNDVAQATGDATMTKVMNQGAREMAVDELELVSGGVILGPAGGHDLGPAASMQGREAGGLPPQPAGAS
jgi:hypothetical protein